MKNLFSAIVLSSVMSIVLGNAAGPPIANQSSLCTDMIPTGHNGGVSLATGAAPYTIMTSASEYTLGGTITVTIAGIGMEQFKGFFIQARRADTARNTQTAIGSFSGAPATTQLLTCHSNANSAWAHSDSTARATISAMWTAPAQDEGPIEFRATIVKGVPDKNYFYLNVTSAQVNLAAATQPPGPTSAAPIHSLSTALACLATVLAGVFMLRRN